MHGYFIDMRLYRKAKSIVEPLSLSRYKQNKVKERIDQQRASRVQLQVDWIMTSTAVSFIFKTFFWLCLEIACRQ